MITGYDPASRTLTTGVGDLIGFARLPDTLVPSRVSVTLQQRQRIHSAYQNSLVRQGWRSEVPLKKELKAGGIRFVIRGRADLMRENGEGVKLMEVKTVTSPPAAMGLFQDRSEASLQLYFYAMAVSEEMGIPLAKVSAKLVFLDISDSEPEPSVQALDLSDKELEREWTRLTESVADYLKSEDARKQEQLKALESFNFPYGSMRPGQEEMVRSTRKCIEKGENLLVQAPTGTGKTAAIISGSIGAALPARQRLFFLTAKNTQKAIVRETVKLIADQGLSIRTVFLTAKMKVCHRERECCFPDDCPYASDFAGRVRGANLMQRLMENVVTGPEEIMEEAHKAGVCAFEVSLFLAERCDMIVCDYNYVFDPHVFLRRFFLERRFSGECVLLIDEAANLPSRARDYYSPEIRESWIEAISEEAQTAGMKRLLNKWSKVFEEWKALQNSQDSSEFMLPGNCRMPLNTEPLLKEMEKVRDPSRTFRDFTVSLMDFSRMDPEAENYFLLFRRENNDHVVQWFCTDASSHLFQRLSECGGAVAFSATIKPFDHYRYNLGLEELETSFLKLEYPFPEENLGVWIVPGIDTRYRARKKSAPALASMLQRVYTANPGTWMAFFPSYAYLRKIAAVLESRKVPVMAQTAGMDRGSRMAFIDRIGTEPGIVLTVSGGIFAEGIDLRSDSLLGAAIVGPSLPGMDLRNRLLSKSYKKRGMDGFLHTWVIPGMNRVIQAAGRLIRNETERKVILLIGRRFARSPYFQLLPSHWFSEGSISLIGSNLNAVGDFLRSSQGRP